MRSFKPDIVVSDIAMPVEDGYSFLRKVRRLRGRMGKIPALALTANSGPSDVEMAFDAGFQHHLAKPVEASLLGNAILRYAKPVT